MKALLIINIILVAIVAVELGYVIWRHPALGYNLRRWWTMRDRR